jgi:hypothetical protein
MQNTKYIIIIFLYLINISYFLYMILIILQLRQNNGLRLVIIVLLIPLIIKCIVSLFLIMKICSLKYILPFTKKQSPIIPFLANKI